MWPSPPSPTPTEYTPPVRIQHDPRGTLLTTAAIQRCGAAPSRHPIERDASHRARAPDGNQIIPFLLFHTTVCRVFIRTLPGYHTRGSSTVVSLDTDGHRSCRSSSCYGCSGRAVDRLGRCRSASAPPVMLPCSHGRRWRPAVRIRSKRRCARGCRRWTGACTGRSRLPEAAVPFDPVLRLSIGCCDTPIVEGIPGFAV